MVDAWTYDTWACLDAALAWERRPGMHIRPQALKIERLGVMPGSGSFPTLPSKQPLIGP